MSVVTTFVCEAFSRVSLTPAGTDLCRTKAPEQDDGNSFGRNPDTGTGRETFLKTAEPTKFLVFSHWRFVPGAIALMASDAIERDLKISDTAAWRRGQVLRFSGGWHFPVFDVAFPSPALASIADPIVLAGAHLGDIDCRELQARAVEQLRAALGPGRCKNRFGRGPESTLASSRAIGQL